MNGSVLNQPIATEHAAMARAFKVALVYPPFGPSGLPNLGLALLSAGVKERGVSCRTFDWNLELLRSLPGRDRREQLAVYRELDGRLWHPFNEWIFNRVVHDKFQSDCAETNRVLQLVERERCETLSADDLVRLRDGAEELVAAMVDRLEPYDLVGIDTSFFQNLPALALARRVKDRWPNKQTVLGGANCDGEMGRALLERSYPFVDVVFSGEVDHSFPEFVARIASDRPIDDDITGVIRRLPDGTLIEGPPAPPLEDLDCLPLPDFDDYIEARRQLGLDKVQDTVLALESSRGCWWGERHHCTFCGLNANGMGYRQKSHERFQWEVETVVNRYGAKSLFMADNILSMRYYREFMDWARTSSVKVDCFYEIKANVTREQAKRLANANITAVQAGIESFSSKVLSLMRKGTTGIQNIALLKYAREYGIYTAYNLLVGFPGEDPAEYERMALEMPKLFHLRPPSGLVEVEFHRFSPYHQSPEQFKLRLRPSAKYDFLYPLPRAQIARIAYLFEREDADGIDRSYWLPLRDQVTRWRQVYEEGACALTWSYDGNDVVVEDRRSDFLRRRYRVFVSLRRRCLELSILQDR